MHELALTNDILTTVLETARRNGARRIVSINLRVGQMRDLVPEWMQRYFDYCSKGTEAEGALLRIAPIAVLLACRSCHQEFTDDVRSPAAIRCPTCGSAEAALKRGMELYIEGIEVQ